MNFCPFRSTADKEIECSTNCALHMTQTYEQEIYNKPTEIRTYHYCAIAFNAYNSTNDNKVKCTSAINPDITHKN